MNTQLRQILTITGEPGLFKAINFNKKGVIVESVDEKKAQSLKTTTRNQIVCLMDISIYGTVDPGTIPLYEIFARLYIKAKEGIAPEVISSKERLRTLLYDLVPVYDSVRVKDHEIKRIVTWYNILLKYYPEVLSSIPAPKELL